MTVNMLTPTQQPLATQTPAAPAKVPAQTPKTEDNSINLSISKDALKVGLIGTGTAAGIAAVAWKAADLIPVKGSIADGHIGGLVKFMAKNPGAAGALLGGAVAGFAADGHAGKGALYGAGAGAIGGALAGATALRLPGAIGGAIFGAIGGAVSGSITSAIVSKVK